MHPHRKKSSKDKYVYIFLAIVVVFGSFLFFGKDGISGLFFWKNNKTPEETKNYYSNQEVIHANGPEDLLAFMRKAGNISKPEVKSSKSISINNLPTALKGLIPTEASSTTVKSVIYKDNSAGYLIEFNISKTVLENFETVKATATNEWELVYHNRSNIAALVSYKSDKYTILSELTSFRGDETKIQTFVVSK